MFSRKLYTLVVTVVLLIVLLPSAALACPSEEVEIHVKGEGDCHPPDSEWHFVINGIESPELAPDKIWVEWDDGEIEEVPLQKFTGKVAHYSTTSHGPYADVVDAWTQIYGDWDGQFNISHRPCPAPPTFEIDAEIGCYGGEVSGYADAVAVLVIEGEDIFGNSLDSSREVEGSFSVPYTWEPSGYQLYTANIEARLEYNGEEVASDGDSLEDFCGNPPEGELYASVDCYGVDFGGYVSEAATIEYAAEAHDGSVIGMNGTLEVPAGEIGEHVDWPEKLFEYCTFSVDATLVVDGVEIDSDHAEGSDTCSALPEPGEVSVTVAKDCDGWAISVLATPAEGAVIAVSPARSGKWETNTGNGDESVRVTVDVVWIDGREPFHWEKTIVEDVDETCASKPEEPSPPTTTVQGWIDGEGPGDTGEDPDRGWVNGEVTLQDVLDVYGVVPPDLFRDEGNGSDKVEIRFGIIDVEELPGSNSRVRRIKVTNVREIFRVPYSALSKGRIILELPGDRVMFVQFGEHGSFHVFGLPQSWSSWDPKTGIFLFDKADYNLIRHWGGRWSFTKDRHSGREEDPGRIFDYAMIVQLALAKRGFGFQDDHVQQEMARRGQFSLWQYPAEPFEGLAPWAEQCIATLIGEELVYTPGWTPKWIIENADGTYTDLRAEYDIIRGYETLPGHPERDEDWATYVLRTHDTPEWEWLEEFEVPEVVEEAETVYVVEAGDTLFEIAEAEYGDGELYPVIAEANGIEDPDLIEVGQGLVIPEL